MLHEGIKAAKKKAKEKLYQQVKKKTDIKFKKWADLQHEKVQHRLMLRKNGIELKYITNDRRTKAEKARDAELEKAREAKEAAAK